MPEYTFQHNGEDKIVIDSPLTSIVRTKKDFETFYDHLNATVSEVLLPPLREKNFVRWVQDVLYYNANFREIALLKDFLTNESFYITVEEDTFKFLRKYSDLIERKLSFGSNYKHIGIFVDSDSEERLYALENKFKGLGKIRDELENTFATQVHLTKTLNEKCEFLKLNLKYFISSSHHNTVIAPAFSNETRNKEIIDQLEGLAEVFGTIVGLFDRRRQFYERYKKIKEKLLKDKLQPENKEETLQNPQAVLEALMQEIKKYNINLIHFLERHEIVTGVELKMANSIKDINDVLNNNNEA